jgi:hypothetical protein
MSSQNVFEFTEPPPSYDSIKHLSNTAQPSYPTSLDSSASSEEHYHVRRLNELNEATEEQIEQTLSLEQRLSNLIKRHDINRFFFDLLKKHLFGSKLVFICDDSATSSHFSHNSPPSSQPRQFLRVAIEIACLANPSGVDVFFVRRPTARHIKHLNDLEPFLLSEPEAVDRSNNYNTLVAVVRQVLAENCTPGEFGMHLVVLGDAEPVNELGESDTRGFTTELNQSRTHVFTTWVSFSKREDSGRVLERWTTGYQLVRFMASQHISVDKRFLAIEQQCSAEPKYSLGDYVALNLIGCLDIEIRDFDISSVGLSVTIEPPAVVSPASVAGRRSGKSVRYSVYESESTAKWSCSIS